MTVEADAAFIGCFYRFGHRLTGTRAALLLARCYQTLEKVGQYVTKHPRKSFDKETQEVIVGRFFEAEGGSPQYQPGNRFRDDL